MRTCQSMVGEREGKNLVGIVEAEGISGCKHYVIHTVRKDARDYFGIVL